MGVSGIYLVATAIMYLMHMTALKMFDLMATWQIILVRSSVG